MSHRPLGLTDYLSTIPAQAPAIPAEDSSKLEREVMMTSVLVPDEAASHLGAILLAFNRQIFGSFLDEADELARLGQAASAILIAGTVLEYFERSPAAGVLPPERRGQIAEWRQLRNQVAHGSAIALTVRQARQVIDGVRQLLEAPYAPGGPVDHPHAQAQAGAAAAVKGKYSHVPTSSGDFIKRKGEDLELEDRG
jgi:hypothetical protein